MYCPTCGSANIESAKFCRICGVNLGLVKQAITGQLTEARPDKLDQEIERKRKSSIECGIKRIIFGVVFLILGLAFLEMGEGPCVVMFIPAFILLRKGAGLIVSAKYERKSPVSSDVKTPSPTESSTTRFSDVPLQEPPASYKDVGAYKTGDLVPPPSITENTPRLFDR